MAAKRAALYLKHTSPQYRAAHTSKCESLAVRVVARVAP